MRFTLVTGSVVALLLPTAALAPAALGGEFHPVESELRHSFPTLALDSTATFDASDAVVNGRRVAGLRVHTSQERTDAAERTLRLQYPDAYDDPFVVEAG